jgi:uncharacterized protein
MNETSMQPEPVLKKIVVLCAFEITLAFVINAVFGAKSLLLIAREGPPITIQICWGMTVGFVTSIVVTASVLFVPLFSKLRSQLIDLVRLLDIGSLNPIWLSIFAGVGEETLFRGSLQPILGLWWTSLIFAVPHMNPKQYRALDWGMFGYFISVFTASLLLGTVYSEIGLVAAIVTHVTWDIVVLFWLRHESRARFTSA